jgi:hypothetical protein
MTSENSGPLTAKELFLAAVEIEGAEQRSRYLDAATCGDATKSMVRKLLAAHENGNDNLLDEAVARFGPPAEVNGLGSD